MFTVSSQEESPPEVSSYHTSLGSMSLGHILRSHVPKAILQGYPTAGFRMGLLETGLWSANAVNRPQPLNCKAGPNPVLSHTVGAQQGRELGGSFTRAKKTDRLL